MIDIPKAKQELKSYVQNQKIDQPQVTRKLDHIMRVSKISKDLAQKLNLKEEQVDLAELIGLLHDIGRFEQYKKQETSQKFNHGEAGVKLLQNNQYIRAYLKENQYDEIVLTAIYEHNRYELDRGLSEEKELFCKIIKDADKIDLIYEGACVYWQNKEEIQKIENGKLSSQMLENFYQYKLADIRNKVSKTDEIIQFTSFVFDLNFSYSLQVIKENNNINKMLDRFSYQIPETKKEMIKVKEIVNKYIEKYSSKK